MTSVAAVLFRSPSGPARWSPSHPPAATRAQRGRRVPSTPGAIAGSARPACAPQWGGGVAEAAVAAATRSGQPRLRCIKGLCHASVSTFDSSHQYQRLDGRSFCLDSDMSIMGNAKAQARARTWPLQTEGQGPEHCSMAAIIFTAQIRGVVQAALTPAAFEHVHLLSAP